jgi:hypothetical protein
MFLCFAVGLQARLSSLQASQANVFLLHAKEAEPFSARRCKALPVGIDDRSTKIQVFVHGGKDELIQLMQRVTQRATSTDKVFGVRIVAVKDLLTYEKPAKPEQE